MPKKAVCIKVPKVRGEKAIVLANKLKIFKKELEVQRNKNFIYIPLFRRPSESELKIFTEQVPDSEVLTRMF
jgi:hypothetical protein